MQLGRVVGCVWSTVKNPELEGQRLLVVQPITPEGRNTGRRIICADWTGAGAGETVYWCRGKESSFPFLPREVPTDTTIVGIVDSIHLKRPAAPQPASAAGPARPPSSPRRKKAPAAGPEGEAC